MSTHQHDLSFAAIAARRAATAAPTFPALVTIETAERFAHRALSILEHGCADPKTDIEHARLLLRELIAHTTARTAMDVREQPFSDAISDKATDAVQSAIESFNQVADEHVEIANAYSRLDGLYHP